MKWLMLFGTLVFAQAVMAAPTTLVTFGTGEQPQNLAEDKTNGDIYVSLLLPSLNRGEVHRYSSAGLLLDAYEMPVGTVLTAGLVFNSTSRMLYLNLVGVTLEVDGLHIDPGATGVYRLDPDIGIPERYGILPLPAALPILNGDPTNLLNGLTADGDGNLYANDSLLMRIWKIPNGGGPATVWSQLPGIGSLAPLGGLLPPGLNGLKFSPSGDLYVSVSNDFRIDRIAVNPDGSAGTRTTFLRDVGVPCPPAAVPPLLTCEVGQAPSALIGLTPDDFIFDQAGNMYLATEPSNSVQKITSAGARTVLANGAQGLANTTATLFSSQTGHQERLFFTNGSLTGSPAPTLMYLDIPGATGHPIADWVESAPIWTPPELMFAYGVGENLQNLAFDKNTGDLYVSYSFPTNAHMVRRLSPVGSPPTSYVETAQYAMPSGTLQAGGLIYNSTTDMLYVALSGLNISGVWQIDPTLANPTVDPYALISSSNYPSPGFMGMTPDADGNIYIADTISGWIFKVPDGGGTFAEWVNANTAGLPSPFPPGPNGLKLGLDGQLYVSHSLEQKVLRYPVNPDGSAGTPTVFVGGLGSGMFLDDFTFGVSGNMYMATEPGMTVEMISPSAERTVIAGLSDGLEHPTAVQCGVLPGDETNLYIVTLAPSGAPYPAGVYRMGIGEACYPLNDGPT